MDLDLENILEINEIRKLIVKSSNPNKKNLLIFFDELIKAKNINLHDNESFYSETDDSDFSCEYDSDD